MAQVRQGIALLESLLCDDNAYLDPPTPGGFGTNASGARDTTCISPNQPWNTGRNLVWAVPPAVWNWGTAQSPISGHAQVQNRTAYLLDDEFYEIIRPDHPSLPSAAVDLGSRGWPSANGTVPGGSYNYQAGGWAVGQFGHQTILIKQDGWYYFGLNMPFKAGAGASQYTVPSPTVPNHVVANDAMRIHAQLWVNNAVGETDTFGSDWSNGGPLGAASCATGAPYPYINMQRHKKYGNAQYSTCVYLLAGALVQIRVKGMAEVYNGPAGTLPTAVTHGQTTANGNTKNKKWDQVIFDSWESNYYNSGSDSKDANPASLMIEHLPDVSSGGFPTFCADATTNENGNFYPASETMVKYAPPRRVDQATYSYNFAQSPGRVTVDETGFYQFSFHYRYEIDANVDENCCSVVRVYKNGTLWNTDGPGEIRPVSSQINLRQKTLTFNDTGGGAGTWKRLDKYGTANCTTLVKLLAGDYIEFKIQRENENSATAVSSTNDARGELTVIQITKGTTPDAFAVYTKGHPSSTRYDSAQGGTPHPHTGTITVTTEDYTHLETVIDNETYRLDAGWVAQYYDAAYFTLTTNQRVKSQKAGYLFMCYVAGATVNTDSLGSNYGSTTPNAASNEWQNGYGFGGHSGGSSSIPYGTYGSDPNDPATKDWFSGNQMWIVKYAASSPFENIVARGLQMGLSHYATSSQSTTGTPMNRRHLFAGHIQIASNANRNAVWAGDLTEFPANQQFEIHTSNYAHGQSYPLLQGNNWNSFPGALHRTRVDGADNDIEVTRFYVRNLKRLPISGSGDLTPFNDPTISGDLDRVIHGSGAPVAEVATTAGECAFTNVASGALTVERAKAEANADLIHIIDPVADGETLDGGTATTTGEVGFLLTASGSLRPAVGTTIGSGTRLPQFQDTNITAEVALVFGNAQYAHQTGGNLRSIAPRLRANVTYATQGTGAPVANPAYGCGCENGQIIHNNPGDTSIDSEPAAFLADVTYRINASGAPTAEVATVTGDEITVYREGEGALATAVAVVTISATISREVAGAPTAEVATTTGTATSARTASGTLTADPPTLPTITVIWVTTQASGASTAEVATILGDIEIVVEGVGAPTAEVASTLATATLVHEATGVPVAELASITADVDIIRENQNEGTANVTAEPATVLADVTYRINASGSPTADPATTTGTIVGGPEGQGAPTAEPASVTPDVDISRMASAAPTAERASTTVDADLYHTATAELQVAISTVAASGAVSLQASGTLTADPPTLPTITVIWVTTQASGAPTAEAATVTGDEITVYHHATVAITPEPASVTADVDIIRENQNEGTANVTPESPTIGGQVVHVIPATSATTAELASITADVDLIRDGAGVPVAEAATTAGTANGTTQFTSSNITASVATAAGAGVKVHTETAAILPLAASVTVDVDIIRENQNEGTANVTAELASITADVDIIRENQNTGTANVTAEPATVTPSVSLIRQASVTLTVLVPSTTATGDVLRHGSGTPTAEIATVLGTIDRVVFFTGTPNVTAEPASITADVDIIRENQNEGTANVTAEPATTQGTGVAARQCSGTLLPLPPVMGGYFQVGADVACTGNPVAEPALVTADVDIGGSSSSANVTTEPASITADVSLIREGSGVPVAEVATTVGTGQTAHQLAGTLTVAAATVLGTIDRVVFFTGTPNVTAEIATVLGTIDRVVFFTGTPNVTAELASITADVDIIRENQNTGTANVTAEPASITADVDIIREGSGTLTVAAATVLGTIDRVVFFTGTPNLSPAVATIIGVAGSVLAPSTNYNITLPSQSYVVYGIFD